MSIIRPTRRSVLAGLGVTAGTLTAGGLARAQGAFAADPFTLGIASGDPSPDGFVLWTRLAPKPLQGRGGMGSSPVPVTFVVARDEALRDVVRTGETLARVELAHSVHVEVEGLEPGRDYFYGFRAGGVESPVGRARTLPAPGSAVAELRFASAGCQAWEGGFYTAWRAIAAERLDFVAHYGDYIYEYATIAPESRNPPLPRGMPQDFGVCYTLTDYRRRYALYKTDPDLQAAHASCPFLASYDDHEIVDNWADDRDPANTPPELFLLRRQAALQAWYEHQPVRRAALPRGPDLVAYRDLRLGRLLHLAVLDTRLHRSRQPCGDGFKAGCAEIDRPERTLLGEAQERWLGERLSDGAADTTWHVFAQQVLFAPVEARGFPWVREKVPGTRNLDAWDGASAARGRMLDLWRGTGVRNPVVLTGDAHFGMALEIPSDGRVGGPGCAGVEFLATSISSGGDGRPDAAFEMVRADNPHLKLFSDRRGYTRHTVTPRQWRADYQEAERVTVPGAAMATRRSFVVEAGRPGLTMG
ncbi:MAG TPA: alkaline phosphatase D family protein [Beijerinckiaceae bacterium]